MKGDELTLTGTAHAFTCQVRRLGGRVGVSVMGSETRQPRRIRVRALHQWQVSTMPGRDLQPAICAPRNALSVRRPLPASVLRSAIFIKPSGRVSLQMR
jgi:hypothetical protein